MDKKYKLTKIKLDEVSLVGSGDDPRASVVLSKSDSSQDGSDTIPRNQLGGNGMGGKKEAPAIIDKSTLSDDVREYIDALEEVILAKDDDDSSDDDDEYGEDEYEDGEEDEDDDDGEDDQDDEPKTKARSGKVGKSDKGRQANDNDERQPVTKADMRRLLSKADPEVRGLISKMQEQVNRAEAIAKHERDERERKEWIAKASTLVHVNDNPEHLGGLLKALHDKAPDEAVAVEKLLRAANNQVAKSGMWEEIGRTGDSFSGSALDMKTAELIKADPNLTKEQAESRALELDPSLYDEYLTERGMR